MKNRGKYRSKVQRLQHPGVHSEELREEWLALEEKFGRDLTQEMADAMTEEEVDGQLAAHSAEYPTPFDRLRELQVIFGKLHGEPDL